MVRGMMTKREDPIKYFEEIANKVAKDFPDDEVSTDCPTDDEDDKSGIDTDWEKIAMTTTFQIHVKSWMVQKRIVMQTG